MVEGKRPVHRTFLLIIVAAALLISASLVAFYFAQHKGILPHGATPTYNATVAFTISDTPSMPAAVSALYIKIKSISILNRTTGKSYTIQVSAKKAYNLAALKNIYDIIGNTSVPAGVYDEIIINVSSVTAVVNGTNQSVLMPKKTMKIFGRFVIGKATFKGSTNWINVDINPGRSLHRLGGGAGRLTMLPVTKTSLRQDATLNANPDGTASVTVWGITPIFYNSGMDLSGTMQPDFLVPQSQDIIDSGNGTLEDGGTAPNQNGPPIAFENTTPAACSPGYVLGNDNLCHPECGGSGNYCSAADACYNNQCLSQSSCPEGYYLAVDGSCYLSEGNMTQDCPGGYFLATDGNCYANETNITSTCDYGYSPGADGYCYPDLTVLCPRGELPGVDGSCNPETVNETDCPNGYVLDGNCYENATTTIPIPECSSGYYMDANGYCYPENTTAGTTCPEGFYLATDGYCYPYSNETTTTALSCPYGYYLANDGNCYPESNYTAITCQAGYYQVSESLCCPDGTYLGSDGNCQAYTNSTTTVSGCPDGYYLATDGYCYPYYNTTTIELSCPDGYYLASDGNCYPISTTTVPVQCSEGYYQVSETGCCPNGTYLGSDGNCYSESTSTIGYYCPDGYYQVSADTCCPDGTYLGSDGNCYYSS